MTKPIGLYIHVPFCVTKCNYCSFYSTEYNKNAAFSWKNRVVRELSKYEQIYDTVFFGGGTPSLLWAEIAELLPLIPTTSDSEITVECNPDDVTPTMLEALRNAGVNRVSIGIQSLDDEILLKNLGRRHDSRQAVNAVELARSAGFENISADLMLGVPGQTANDIEKIARLPVTHVSAYMYENQITMPDDEVAELYLKACEILPSQYEISNFGFPCRHNLKYWRCEEYIGIGQTAHSFYGGKRFAMDENWETYVTEESVNTFEEKVMLGLRLTEGIELTEILKQRAKSIPEEYIKISGNRLSLTKKGFLTANRIIIELLGND